MFKFKFLCWATFIALLGCMQPMGHQLDPLASRKKVKTS